MYKAIFFGSIAFLFAAAAGTSAQSPSPRPNTPASSQSPNPAPAVKVQTRLITVDVVVTDSHGNAVRDLKQDDFKILDGRGGPQKIARFEFMDASANPPAARGSELGTATSGAHVFSNRGLPQPRVPPTILLMDALNTEITNPVEVHKHMLLLLKTLPPNTPVAVFTLGHTLRVVQNFTTDPGLLKVAVDHALRSVSIEQNPQDDANSASNQALDQNGDVETSEIQTLESFEKEEYEAQMAVRVDDTTDAMVGIAKYLGGYPGRKNLIWFSESFPLWIEPTSDFGGNPALSLSPSTTKLPGQEFAGSASYTEKVRAAAEALTDAQVAVYPVDAKGLETAQLYSAAQDPHINRFNPGAGFGSQLTREDTARFESQDTMNEIAASTGGRICANTNDLSGCVQSALNDGSSYYELAYYPENVKWDGHFQKITIKSEQHGVKLAYRRGYFATDAQARLSQEKPEALLQQVCIDPLPATSISLTAEAVPPLQAPGQTAQARYLLTISPTALSLEPEGGSRRLRLQMAICEYDPKGDKFQIFPRDLSGPVSEAVYKGWQERGIRSIFDFSAKDEDGRLRFAVLDVPSGMTGSVDVPAHPREFGAAPGAVAPEPAAAAPAAGATAPAVAPQRAVTTSLVFKSSSGATSKLDWKSETMQYTGDLDVAVGARAFFQQFLGGQFHCQAGTLVPNDSASAAVPKLAFAFESATAALAVVDLAGDEPKYSGALPVDSTAKPFFDQVWKLCHCQQP
ncbi:MAG TPA: VWA domain-containing protein [Candidatus Acidoferrales bacterium]|nr:VWA domain-containing protein [Candidatus Acidoferrales bacterium]